MNSPMPEALLKNLEWTRALARRLVQDEHLADDVAQEACVAALRSKPRAVRAWLRQVVRNLVIDRQRRDARRRRREQTAARSEATPPTDTLVARAETQRRVVGAVLALEEPYRTAILLRYFEGLAPKEIARRFGEPASTVRSRLTRALEKLRSKLDDEFRGRHAWCLALAGLLLLPALGRAEVSAATGALFMSTKIKSVVALALMLLLTAVLGWRFVFSEDDTAPRTQQTRAPAAPETPRAETPKGNVAEPLPPSVDLGQVDRDLDLHGTVVNGDGAPVAGANLDAVYYPWRRGRLAQEPLKWEVTLGPATRSAVDGTFRLRLERGDLVNLRVEAEGFASTELNRLQAGERVDVVLERGVRLVVKVLDEAGGPVAGAHLRLWRHEGLGSPRYDLRKRSDARGQYTFEAVPRARPAWLWVWGLSFARSRTYPEILETGEVTHEVVLKRGRVVRGRVTDADTGEPIAGATAGIDPDFIKAVQTDGDGRFELRGWAEGWDRDLHVRAEGYAPEIRFLKKEAAVDVALSRAVELIGRIVDGDGRAVVGARVRGWVGQNERGEPQRTAVTDSIGQFRLGPTHPATTKLAVSADGYATAIHEVAWTATQPWDAGEIVLLPGREIAGRVLGADAKPLARAYVKLSPYGKPAAKFNRGRRLDGRVGMSLHRFSDDLGRFTFRDLGAGLYRLSARPRGELPVARNVELPEDSRRVEVELQTRQVRRLNLLLVDSAGRPVPHATAEFVMGHLARPSWTTDETGHAVLTAEMSMNRLHLMRVRAGKTYYVPLDGRQELGSRQEDVRFVIERAEYVTGKVLEAGGTPLPRANVDVYRDGKRVTFAATNTLGEFRVLVPVHGQVDLLLHGKSGLHISIGSEKNPATVRVLDGELHGVTAGSKGLVIRATEAVLDRTLDVLVLSPDGEAVPGVRVGAWISTGAVTDRNGRARLTKLPHKEVTVSASFMHVKDRQEGWLFPTWRRVVPGGQQIVMQFRKGIPIRGRVLLSGGKPAAYASVRIHVGDTNWAASADGEGRFTILYPAGAKQPARLVISHPYGYSPLHRKVLDNVRPSEAELRIQFDGTRPAK